MTITLDETQTEYLKLSHREKGVSTLDIIYKEGYPSGGITYDDDITWTHTYTADSSTSEANVFTGRIDDYTLDAEKRVRCVSKQEEINRYLPKGTYQGKTGSIITHMIDKMDSFISYYDYGLTTETGYYQGIYQFRNETGKDADVSFIDSAEKEYGSAFSGISPSTQSRNYVLVSWTAAGALYRAIHNIPSDQESGTIDWWMLCDSLSPSTCLSLLKIIDRDGNEAAGAGLRITTGDLDCVYGALGSNTLYETTSVDTWYRFSLDFECGSGGYKGLAADKYNIAVYNAAGSELASITNISFDISVEDIRYIHLYINNTGGSAAATFDFDDIGMTWLPPYEEDDNADLVGSYLPIGSVVTVQPVNGMQPLSAFLDTGAKAEEANWYLEPDGILRWETSPTDSGVTIPDSSGGNVWDVSATIQIKRINEVQLTGGYGLQSTAIDESRQSSAGRIIYKDYLPNVIIQTELDTIALNILNTQKDPPMTVYLTMYYPTVGFIQAGQTVAIGENSVRYSYSEDYVPSGDYRIVSIDYIFENGEYTETILKLEDGMSFTKPLEMENANAQAASLASSIPVVFSGGAPITIVDSDAIHDDVAEEIYQIDTKGTPSVSDILLLEDSEDNYEKKKMTISSLPAAAPASHALDSTVRHSINDNEYFNASTSNHGFLKKLDGNPSHYMNGTGSWSTPPDTTGISELSEDATPQLGGPLDINGESIQIGCILGSDHTYEGLVISGITNSESFGLAVCMSSNNTVTTADKDIDTVAIGISVGTNLVLYSGTVRDDSWDWTAGDSIFVGDSGALTDDTSSYTTNDMVQVIGVALNADTILVHPVVWLKLLY